MNTSHAVAVLCGRAIANSSFFVFLGCLLACGADLSGQDLDPSLYCPLGDEPTVIQASMQLVQPTEQSSLGARMWFDTESKTVYVAATYWKPPAVAEVPGYVKQAVSVSYLPTAIAVAAPVATTFFVAGYVPRTQQVVIERWVFDNIATSEALHPGESTETLGVSFILRKDVVIATNQLEPLEAIAYHPANGSLWILESGVQKTLSRVSVDTGAVTWVADSATIPALAGAHSISRGLISTTHASGGGMMFYFAPWQSWDASFALADAASLSGVALYDTNLDGVQDQTIEMTWAEMKQFGFLDASVPLFTE